MAKFIDFDVLASTPWPEEIFIDGGLLSRGDTMLIGAESKAGKSTLLAGLMREMISGGDFLGFKVMKPLKVGYMQAELRENRLVQRLVPTYGQLDPEYRKNFNVWTTRGLVMIELDIDDIRGELETLKPDVLVIDPMINFHSHNENDAKDMMDFFRKLDNLKEKSNLAIIMAHHFKKAILSESGKQLPLLEMIRGTSALRGWAVTTIAMEGRTASEFRELQFDTRNSDEPIKRTIKYNKDRKDFDWHNPIDEVKAWASSYLNGQKVPSEEFIKAMIEARGHFFGRSRTKAYEYKSYLAGIEFLKEERVGKFMMVSGRNVC